MQIPCSSRQRSLPDHGAAEARKNFPRGLSQPPGSFRFSLDALLLASWLQAFPAARLLDLGCGCGVVALGMLCRCPEMAAYGVDLQPGLIPSAVKNAARLGFSTRFSAVCADVRESDLFTGESGGTNRPPPLQPGSFDLVLANPPYRQRHRGRLPANILRLTALFEENDTLTAFCAAAARALTAQGRFGIIYPAVRKDELFAALQGEGLVPLRVRPVLPRKGQPPSLLLLEAARCPVAGAEGSADSRPITEPALPLHEGEGAASRFSAAALAFCPWLACNA